MITPRNAYSSAASASHAVKQPSRDRLAAPDIRLLTGRRLHDIRREPVGTFAGAVGPDAPVGTFAGARALRQQGSGTQCIGIAWEDHSDLDQDWRVPGE